MRALSARRGHGPPGSDHLGPILDPRRVITRSYRIESNLYAQRGRRTYKCIARCRHVSPFHHIERGGLIFSTLLVQSRTFRAAYASYSVRRHELSQVSRCKLFDNESHAREFSDAVLPFSFSMSSSATLLLRAPGNRETVKKIHTPMRAATHFAGAMPRAASDWSVPLP